MFTSSMRPLRAPSARLSLPSHFCHSVVELQSEIFTRCFEQWDGKSAVSRSLATTFFVKYRFRLQHFCLRYIFHPEVTVLNRAWWFAQGCVVCHPPYNYGTGWKMHPHDDFVQLSVFPKTNDTVTNVGDCSWAGKRRIWAFFSADFILWRLRENVAASIRHKAAFTVNKQHELLSMA